MVKFFLPIFFIILIIGKTTAQIDSYPNLVLWLSADGPMDLNGRNVSSWNDMSPNGYKIIQNTNLSQPLLEDSVLNNKPALYFDGGDYLDGGDILDMGTKGHTMFYLGLSKKNVGAFFSKNANSEVYSRYMLMFYANNSYIAIRDNESRVMSTAMPINKNYLCTFINNRNTGFNTMNINGQYRVKSANGGYIDMQSNYPFYVGASNGNATSFGPQGLYNFMGYIFDIVIYDTVLSNSQISEIENLLMDKYAPRLDLKDTIQYGFCPISLSAKNTCYKSYLWSNGSTLDEIIVSSSGEYWCEVEDIFGRILRDTVNVTFPELAVSNAEICKGDTVIANSGLDNSYLFLWSNGDISNISKIYDKGNYWLKVEDTLGCSSIKYFSVNVDDFPDNFSLGNDVSMCAGEIFSLPSSYSEDSYSFKWSNDSTSNNFVVKSSAKYYLTITNSNKCEAKDSINIFIKGVRPTAVFNKNSVCIGDSTSFTNMSFTQSPDGIKSTWWNFNDEGFSNLNNPKHKFLSAGDFMVKLQVYSDSGCYADTSILVHVHDLPKIDFTPINSCNKEKLYLKSHSIDNEKELIYWSWDFGDGENSLDENPIHIFDSTGIYDVKLTVTNTIGCSQTLSKQVKVKLKPVTNFEFEETCLGHTTYFKEITEMPTHAEIIYRFWDFGDGSFSTLKTPQHVYSSSGSYDVMLINKSINGCSDTLTKKVIVHSYPEANFIFDTICENAVSTFIDTSKIIGEKIVGRKWDFGIKTMSDSIATIIFPDSGKYQVRLTVVSNFGCENSKSRWIYVNPAPIADFSIIPEYGIPPFDVRFYNYSIDANKYLWNMGDGFVSEEQNPSHIYESEGVFEAVLIATTSKGCKDTSAASVYVIPSSLDIVITDLDIVDSSGYYTISVSFFNNGTRSVRDIAFDAKIDNNISINEVWHGYLRSGETTSYKFSASFVKSDTKKYKSLCVQGNDINSDQSDENPQNNSLCFALMDGFYVVSTYPNPAQDYVVVDVAVPDDGNLTVKLCNEKGVHLEDFVFNDITAGSMRLKIDVKDFAPGIYILKLYYKDKEESILFMKE